MDMEPISHDETIAAVWPVAGDRRRPRRGRHPVYQWLRLGFVVLLAVLFLALIGVTVLAGHSPAWSGSAYLALINIDVALLVLLVLYVVRRVVVLALDRRGRLRGSRLHLRMLLIFTFLAAFPAVSVGGAAIYLLNQGIESWFSAKVSMALEGGEQVASGYFEESGRSLLGETNALAQDPFWQLPPLLLGHDTVASWLRSAMSDKRMDELALVDDDGQVMASGTGFRVGTIPSDVLNYLQNNGVQSGAQVFSQGNGMRMTAVAPLKNGWWLVGQRSLNPDMLARIAETRAAYHQYVQMREYRTHIRWVVSLFLLMLLGAAVASAVWAGIRLANKIVQPVTALVHGTNRVSAGDLSVRLEPRDDDELGVLTQSFNRMTLQLATNRELLERKNHELDERRRFIEAILTGVSSGVAVVDDDGVVRVANQTAQKMLKVQLGTKLDKVTRELADMVRAVARGENGPGKGIVQHEVKLTVAEGDTRTLLVRLVPLIGGQGIVLTFDDITPLIGAQRLAAWQDVARRLAHEIKNPLTPIQLSAERLKRRYLKKLPEEDSELFAQLCDTIVQQSEEMRRMTNEFSDFARMPQARLEPENMIALLDDVVSLQQGRDGVDYHCDYTLNNAMVRVDKGQVQRVFTNLLENAYNAIAEREGTNLPQGRVEIVAAAQQNGMLMVEIRDNGRGLPPNVEVETLFDPYVTTRKGGTGLGLAIVKKVMDEHGGTVRLLRRKGGGTTVELGFPLAQGYMVGVAPEKTPADDQPVAKPRTKTKAKPKRKGKAAKR